jgi:nitrate/nitrite transporter NarK
MGGLGGVIFSAIVPGFLVKFVGYTPLFMMMSSFYLIALFILHKLMGDLEPIRLGRIPDLSSATLSE